MPPPHADPATHASIPVWNAENWFYEKLPKYPTMGLVRSSYEVFKGEGELVLCCEHLQTAAYRAAPPGPGK